MEVEKRRAARHNVDVSGEVYTPSAVLPASTRNLSETGICFDIEQELVEDSVVGVSLFLVSDGIEDPDAEPLNIKAKVMWCTERDNVGFSAGMRFDELGQTENETIQSFLNQL